MTNLRLLFAAVLGDFIQQMSFMVTWGARAHRQFSWSNLAAAAA